MDVVDALVLVAGGLGLVWWLGQRSPASGGGAPLPRRVVDLTALRARCVAYSGGDFAAMVDQNPQLPTAMLAWQHGTVDQGGDPYDWDAFRSFLKTIGQPDPGPTLPIIFCGWVG